MALFTATAIGAIAASYATSKSSRKTIQRRTLIGGAISTATAGVFDLLKTK